MKIAIALNPTRSEQFRAMAASPGLEPRVGKLASGFDADVVLLDSGRPHQTPALDPRGVAARGRHGRFH